MIEPVISQARLARTILPAFKLGVDVCKTMHRQQRTFVLWTQHTGEILDQIYIGLLHVSAVTTQHLQTCQKGVERRASVAQSGPVDYQVGQGCVVGFAQGFQTGNPALDLLAEMSSCSTVETIFGSASGMPTSSCTAFSSGVTACAKCSELNASQPRALSAYTRTIGAAERNPHLVGLDSIKQFSGLFEFSAVRKRSRLQDLCLNRIQRMRALFRLFE